MINLPISAEKRLETQEVIWFASVRPDGRPHLVPIWFVWRDGKIYVCTSPASVKSRNIRRNPHVVLALEDGMSPVICEGTATSVSVPWPDGVIAAFQQKYDWEISFEDEQYNELVEVTPTRWLTW